MSTPDRKGLGIEVILDDLYASEINGSLAGFFRGDGRPYPSRCMNYRTACR
jgi:hypothetical protein